ncbi:MAG: DUF4350 domain-containing protein [Terricaulis silvestris]
MSVIAPPAERPKAQLFSIKVVLALLLVGVFSFSAFFTLSAFAPELMSGDDGRAHALSKSSVGFAAAVDLERRSGAQVTVSRTPFDEVRHTALFVLTPEAPLSDDALTPLANQRVLIILPKWAAGPKVDHRGWVVRYGAYPPQMAEAMVSELTQNMEVTRLGDAPLRATLHFMPGAGIGDADTKLTPGPIANLQALQGGAVTPIIQTEGGRTILARVGDRPIYILSDPDLLNTSGMANIDTARAGLAILDSLRDADEPVAFDVTLNGFARERSILRLAFMPPFLAVTLCLAAVAALLAWRSITRAGPQAPQQRAIALGKQALAENSAALIRLAGREHKMGKGYAALSKDAVIELLGLARSDSAEIDATLDRIGEAQKASSRFTDLAKEAEAAQTPAQALTAARKLNLWKEEMLRGTH